MRISSIDIGTNTILMLTAEIREDGTLQVVQDDHVIARLGRGVDADRNISPETAERALGTLREYRKIADHLGSKRIVAGGTSALRDAANRDQFIQSVEKETGIRINLLSGDEEAELTYLGGVSEFALPGVNDPFAVLDIGGGSTELTIGEGRSIKSKVSLDIGSVRLTERFLKESPPSEENLREATTFVGDLLSQTPFLPDLPRRLIGVAGTLTTLAAIDLGLPHYDRSVVSGHRLSLSKIQTMFDELRMKDLDGLLSFPQILKGRADILVAGILILLQVLRHAGLKEITVSDRGLRYGMALKESLKLKSKV